jgi:SulP family sulfate permease
MVLLLPLILVMAGVLQIAAAYLNIGSFISYISRSVIIGYISAAAVLIIANQVRNIAGITIPEEGTLLGVIESTIARLHLADWPTVLVAAATAAVFLTLKNLAPRLPNVGLTLVASVGIGFVAQQLGYPVAMLPEIVAGNWRPTMPILDFGAVNQLASAALAIAFLGMLEGASIGKSLAAHAGERLNTNQETFALGAANIGCAFLGGMGASGSLTRSVLNETSGASTSLSSFYCGLLSLGMIFGLGHFVGHVPRAALAVIVVFVALSLINVRQIRFVIRSTRVDAVVFALTAGSAFILPLDSAIFLGTATSIILYLRKAGEPELVEYAFNPEGELRVLTTSRSGAWRRSGTCRSRAARSRSSRSRCCRTDRSGTNR